MRPVIIDWSISVGNIISTSVLVLTLVGIAIRFGQRFTLMEKKVNLMFAWFIRQDGAKQLTAEEIQRFFGEGCQ